MVRTSRWNYEYWIFPSVSDEILTVKIRKFIKIHSEVLRDYAGVKGSVNSAPIPECVPYKSDKIDPSFKNVYIHVSYKHRITEQFS